MAQVKKTRLIALLITIPLVILAGIIGIIHIENSHGGGGADSRDPLARWDAVQGVLAVYP